MSDLRRNRRDIEERYRVLQIVSGRTEKSVNGAILKRPTEHEELADEAVQQWQPHRRQHDEEKEAGIHRHRGARPRKSEIS